MLTSIPAQALTEELMLLTGTMNDEDAGVVESVVGGGDARAVEVAEEGRSLAFYLSCIKRANI